MKSSSGLGGFKLIDLQGSRARTLTRSLIAIPRATIPLFPVRQQENQRHQASCQRPHLPERSAMRKSRFGIAVAVPILGLQVAGRGGAASAACPISKQATGTSCS